MAKFPFNPMDVFKSMTDKQRNQQVIKNAETLQELNDLKQLAKNILADQRYEKYRQEFEAMFGRALKELLSYQHQDNNIYAVNVRTTIQQLNDLLAMIDIPTNFLNYVTVQQIELPKQSTLTQEG